jgi:hypothetical protein
MDYRKKARELGSVEKILKWVQNKVKYRMVPFYSTQRTFKRRKGTCLSKTDLAIQMCRAIGLKKEETLYVQAGIEDMYPGFSFPPVHWHPRIKGKNYEISADREAIDSEILPANNWHNIDKEIYYDIPLSYRIQQIYLLIPFTKISIMTQKINRKIQMKGEVKDDLIEFGKYINDKLCR